MNPPAENVESAAPLRVLIVGGGAVVSEYQGPAAVEAQRLGLLEVVGVVDPSEDRLARCRRFFPGARLCTELANAGEADLALIATPAGSHAELAFALLRRGCHLLIEKPICASSADANAVQEEADRRVR